MCSYEPLVSINISLLRRQLLWMADAEAPACQSKQSTKTRLLKFWTSSFTEFKYNTFFFQRHQLLFYLKRVIFRFFQICYFYADFSKSLWYFSFNLSVKEINTLHGIPVLMPFSWAPLIFLQSNTAFIIRQSGSFVLLAVRVGQHIHLLH